jgi:hypothetical protein
MVAPTAMERTVRARLDELDGWGVFQPITIPFTGPLDVESILAGHRDVDYATDDDVVYLINVDRDSKEFGRIHPLDVGNGNYPVVLERIDKYWKNDPRGWLISILFEEEDEDLNGNGVLDPGEDTDADGVLDKPNYLPGLNPARDDLAGRADALMTFYERETNTLIVKPLVPLRERTTYAVVVTRRIKDANGEPVGSPFKAINHDRQTEALKPLFEVLPEGLAKSDIAFAFTYTTQTIEAGWQAVRNGLYGEGIQKHLGEDFPPEVAGMLRLRDEGAFEGMTNPYIMWSENWARAFNIAAPQLLGAEAGSEAFKQQVDNNRYVDFHAIGWYESPQLFPRGGEDVADWLPFDLQSWPEDLDRKVAPARSERVYFYVTVPRKEVSLRGQGKPAPVVILGHGYTSNRYEVATLGPFFAKHGIATIGIDNVSHGISIRPDELQLAQTILGGFGLGTLVDAVFTDRAHDQNGDGLTDTGADFWTAYLFHTRDVVRQSALDYMQLIRVLRAFDGQTRWNLDLNGDGQNELAGDFDGDGVVDIGGLSPINMTGGSLGGMMTTLMAGVEPELSAAAPIVPGGGLGDGGIRSQQSGVPEAFILRPMAPLYVGTLGRPEGDGWVPDPAGSTFYLETIIPDLNDAATRHIATLESVAPGDTFIVFNESTEERGCGYVSQDGLLRAAVASNRGDTHRLAFYDGEQLILGDTDCTPKPGAVPKIEVTTFEHDVEFQAESFPAGTPLVALNEGLGLRRGNPELRRFASLGQAILDPADMAVMAPHILEEPLRFSATNTKTGTHMLLLPAAGDMSVPVNMAMSIGRAAGLIEYLESDPRYDVPVNQLLIDTYTAEAVHTLNRYERPDGVGVHIDLDNFSDGQDIFGDTVPRLDPPLRAKFYERDPLGGKSTFLVAYGTDTGQHGFPAPGESTDDARKQCERACESAEDCDCSTVQVFDTGNFLFNMIGRYLGTNGQVLSDDACMARNDCAWIPPLPAERANPDQQ